MSPGWFAALGLCFFARVGTGSSAGGPNFASPAEFFGVLTPMVHHFGAGRNAEVGAGADLGVVPLAFGFQVLQAFKGLGTSRDHLRRKTGAFEEAEAYECVFVLADGLVEFLAGHRNTEVQPQLVDSRRFRGEQTGFAGFYGFEAPFVILDAHRRERGDDGGRN